MSQAYPHIPGFQIQRELGRGGMATVYLAVQPSLNRPVALKVMAPLLSSEASFGKRFLLEGRTVARLAHPNIVSIHDIGEADGRHYLAMEYVAGGDLKEWIDARGIPPRKALAVLRDIAEALAYAHDEGFVHRDVKPENILFHKTGRAMLSDFGIARAVERTTQLTGTGMSVGTPHYMSPEQCEGSHDIDGRSDLYSLGVVLYEMLTGRVPFDAANTVGIIRKHCDEPRPELPGALSRYQPLLDGLLAVDRKARFPNARSLVGAIEKLQSGKQMARSARGGTVVVRRSRHRSWWKPVVLMLGVSGLAASGWYAYGNLSQLKRLGGGGSLPAAQVSQGRGPFDQIGESAGRPESDASLRDATPAAAAPLTVVSNVQDAGMTVDRIVGVDISSELHTDRDDAQSETAVAPHFVPFTITTDPIDARVKLLGEEMKQGDGVRLPPGRYDVEVSAEGYRTFKDTIDVSEAKQFVHVRLERDVYPLRIQTDPPDASIWVQEVGREFQPGMMLPVGTYTLNITSPGYQRELLSVQVEKEPHQYFSTLVRHNNLTIEVKVSNQIQGWTDAQLTINLDGKRLKERSTLGQWANRELRLDLAPGHHQILAYSGAEFQRHHFEIFENTKTNITISASPYATRGEVHLELQVQGQSSREVNQ